MKEEFKKPIALKRKYLKENVSMQEKHLEYINESEFLLKHNISALTNLRYHENILNEYINEFNKMQ